MDTIFALQGKDFVLVACETTVNYSIFKQKVVGAKAA
jgi:20S proteasome alpha/beta subunit